MKKISVLFLIIILTFLLASTGCKNMAKPSITRLYAMGQRLTISNRSLMYILIDFFNERAGIEVKMKTWNIKIIAGDELLFEFSSNNYRDLPFPMTAQFQFYFAGNGFLKIGCPDAYLSGFVNQDIFKGKTPTKMSFTCTITDGMDNDHPMSGEVDFVFSTVDS